MKIAQRLSIFLHHCDDLTIPGDWDLNVQDNGTNCLKHRQAHSWSKEGDVNYSRGMTPHDGDMPRILNSYDETKLRTSSSWVEPTDSDNITRHDPRACPV